MAHEDHVPRLGEGNVVPGSDVRVGSEVAFEGGDRGRLEDDVAAEEVLCRNGSLGLSGRKEGEKRAEAFIPLHLGAH